MLSEQGPREAIDVERDIRSAFRIVFTVFSDDIVVEELVAKVCVDFALRLGRLLDGFVRVGPSAIVLSLDHCDGCYV